MKCVGSLSMCGGVCVYEEGCVFLCICKGQGKGIIKFYLQCCFLFLYGSRCLLVLVGGGKIFRIVFIVVEGSITGVLVGIYKVCCSGWCTLILLVWISILQFGGRNVLKFTIRFGCFLNRLDIRLIILGVSIL